MRDKKLRVGIPGKISSSKELLGFKLYFPSHESARPLSASSPFLQLPLTQYSSPQTYFTQLPTFLLSFSSVSQLLLSSLSKLSSPSLSISNQRSLLPETVPPNTPLHSARFLLYSSPSPKQPSLSFPKNPAHSRCSSKPL